MTDKSISRSGSPLRRRMTEDMTVRGFTACAQRGYLAAVRNFTGPDGKKTIEADPDVAPLVARLFEWYAPGGLSIKELTKRARAEGLRYPNSGAPVSTSTVHTILRNRLYMGEFEWNGKVNAGCHEPLVARELWERVQGVLDGRKAKRHRRVKHDFAFSSLIECGHCGCAVVGEIKKQRYVYYHCTGYKGKCGEPYVREELLEDRFDDLLGRLTFDDEVMDWLREALRESHADEKREHQAAITRLKAEYDRLQNRIHAAYVDKLDGRIDGAFFDRMSGEWRAEQDRCLRDIDRHQSADHSYLDEDVRLLELARNARRLFAKQEPREKRRLLDFVVSNCSWKDGRLDATYRQPFDLLAETVAAHEMQKAAGAASDGFSEKWLPGSDSNQRPSG